MAEEVKGKTIEDDSKFLEARKKFTKKAAALMKMVDVEQDPGPLFFTSFQKIYDDYKKEKEEIDHIESLYGETENESSL